MILTLILILTADASSLNTDIDVKLFNFLEGNNLIQLIDEPTRVTPTCSTVLDLIITDTILLAIPGNLAPSAQSMIFLANKNPYQHALQA